MALPRFLAITSNHSDKKYMRYTTEDVGGVHGFLKLSGEDILSPLSKYEVKMAKCGNGLVHIKCCYNNKYLQRSSEKDYWIVAGASEPEEEDHAKWSCTLFEPIVAYEVPLSYHFRHVQLGHNVSLCSKEVTPYDSCLEVKSTSEGTYDIFKVIDWETLMVFPKLVAFKGQNHLYLKAFYAKKHPYLQFSATEIGDEYVGDEIFPNNNGSIRIKNNHFGKFWRRNHHDWINADADESSINDHDTVFWPIKVDDNTIALRNEGNGMYCKVFTYKGKTGCLSACDPKISSFSKIEIEELVLSRSIYNVNYHFMDDRIYDKTQTPMTVVRADAVNNTSETNHMDVKLKYTDHMKRSWSSSVSLTLGYKSQVTAGIPKIVGGKAEIYANFSAEYNWGKTLEEETTEEFVAHVTVPPRSTRKVRLSASKGSCDIPFSYTRHDVLLDGRSITYEMHDGIYTCSNCYDFNVEVDQPIHN